MLNNINIFILYILFLQYNTNIIVLPFRENKPKGNINNNNLSNIFHSKELYTEVLIGDPPQCINLNINTESFIYYIQPDLCYDNSPSFYNYSLSKSFHIIISEDDIFNYNDGVYSSDLFSFYNSTDLRTNITRKDFEFFYSLYRYKNYKNICGIAGFGLKHRNADTDIDTFINSLKSKGLIKDYFWTYEYFDKEENKIINFPQINNKYIIDNYDGLIIIGNYSNEYDPIYYDKNSYISTLAVERETNLKWDLVFHKIYCIYNEEISIIKDIHADLSINYDYIISTKEYFEKLILPFFNLYLEKQICKINEIKKNAYMYEVIYCDKKLFTIQDIKKFPTIYFYHHNFNYTFEITYNELFKEINNNIYFLILKNIGTFNANFWKLGKIFLNKYHFSFNQDSKMIIFYNKMKPKNNFINDTENGIINKIKFNINYIWIIICIICLIAGIYIGNKIIIRNRKLRANELQDEYDYKAENINNDNKRYNEKNIEMGVKGLGV